MGIMLTIGISITIRTLGTMGTKENGKKTSIKILMTVEKYLWGLNCWSCRNYWDYENYRKYKNYG